MKQVSRGERLPLAPYAPAGVLQPGLAAVGLRLDFACFALDADGGECRPPHKSTLPAYVMFVTDGTTSDKPLTEHQLRWASRGPIFWQFTGIGKGKKSKSKPLASFTDSDFPFLEKLDELDGRLVDNPGIFSVSSPDEHSDADLSDLLMGEFPRWVKQATSLGLQG